MLPDFNDDNITLGPRGDRRVGEEVDDKWCTVEAIDATVEIRADGTCGCLEDKVSAGHVRAVRTGHIVKAAANLDPDRAACNNRVDVEV
jgi:hypothetical protein